MTEHIRHSTLMRPIIFSENEIPILQGLILTGGKSQRMGIDKATIPYHGVPQSVFLVELLRGLHIEPFLSCRTEQADQIEALKDVKIVTDTFLDLGPMGGILSAFRSNPNVAWLVIACDLPLLDVETLEILINNRRTDKIATAFHHASQPNSLPEPLIAIWEPAAYPVLLSFLSKGVSCPRKVLIHSDIHLLKPSNEASLTNVNTPTEYKEVLNMINNISK